MLEHSQRRAVGPWRRWMFRIWIGITIVLALYVAAVLPFVRDDRIGHFLLGVPVPFVMIALLLIGLGWLGWLVTARRRRSRVEDDHGSIPADRFGWPAEPICGRAVYQSAHAMTSERPFLPENLPELGPSLRCGGPLFGADADAAGEPIDQPVSRP